MSESAKILLVDDDENLVEAMKLTLESNDYRVVVAYNGEEGLKKAKEEKPDLIVLDIMMDKKHGFDVCAELNKDPEFSRTPIIILTGVGQHMHKAEWTRQQGLTLESSDFIEKPIDPADLVKRVKELLAINR